MGTEDARQQALGRIAQVTRGTQLASRYEVVQVLGKGSMGWVVEARDQELDNEQVALKILYPHVVANEKLEQRLAQEIVVTRQLSHPGIVRTFDLEFDPVYGHFISMEYIEGWTLGKALKKASAELTYECKKRIFYSVVQALAFAHARGVLHRDIRPNNILLSAHGEVKLTDFCFSQTLEMDSGLTATGELIGAPEYMAPEQFLGETLDCNSDVYSLGILAYELFSGALPCKEKDYFSVAKSHLHKEVPRLSQGKQLQDSWLIECIYTATRREPKSRFSSAGEMLEFINTNSTLQNELGRPFELRIFRKMRQRRVWRAYLFLAALIGAGMVLAFILLHQRVTREFLAPYVYQAEVFSGYEPRLLKSILRLEGRSDDPRAAYAATVRNDFSSLAGLIRAGVDLTYQDEEGNTFLHLANDGLLKRSLFSTEVSMEQLPLDVVNNNGETPLNYAVKQGRIDIVEFLLQYAPDTRIADNEGNTPLHNAVLRGNSEILALLLPRVALDQRDGHGNTPLHNALYTGNTKGISQLLVAGANPDTRDPLGRSALMILLQNQKLFDDAPSVLKELILHQASLNAYDDRGRSVSEYADEYGTEELRTILETARVGTRDG